MEKTSAFHAYQQQIKKSEKIQRVDKVNIKKAKKVKRNKKLEDKKKEVIKKIVAVNKHESSDEDVPALVRVEPSFGNNNGIEKNVKLIKNNERDSESNEDYDISSEEEEEMVMSPRDIFKWLITPIKLADFFSNYWEKKPLHVKRKTDRYFEALFPSNYLDTMIRENDLYYSKHIDVVTYENGVRETCNPDDGKAIPSALWDYYTNGCSIRIKNPQSYCYRLRCALQELQEYFGSYVGVNLYLTPKNSQGFAPHWDDIDAFVVQIEGKKHWKLYEPKYSSDVLSRISSHNLTTEELGKKIMDLTVNTGDTLYFPRGTVHQARTDEDSHSLHLTISVYQKTTYTDLLAEMLPAALRNASEKHVEFRRGLPLQYLKHCGLVNSNQSNKNENSEVRAKVVKDIKKLIDKLFDVDAIDEGADNLGKRLMEESLPHFPKGKEIERSCQGDGDFLDHGEVYNRTEFNPDTEVRLIRYYAVRLVQDEGFKLYYTTRNSLEYSEENGKFVLLDEKQIPVVETLIHDYPNFRAIEKFPADEGTTIGVITDLWELGLIITKEPLTCTDDPEPDIL